MFHCTLWSLFVLLCLFPCCFSLLSHPFSLTPFPFSLSSSVQFKGMTYKPVHRVTYSLSFQPTREEQSLTLSRLVKERKIGPSLAWALFLHFAITSFSRPLFPLFSSCLIVTSLHLLFVLLSYSSTFYCSMHMNVCLSFICKAISGRCVISSFFQKV